MARALAVTGAGRGIGRAIALRTARDGWSVALSDIDGDAADVVAAEIADAGGHATAERIDITDRTGVERWVNRVDTELGGLTGAVANAGIVHNEHFLDMSEESWRRIVDINVHGTVNFVQAVARRMADRGAGSIVALASASSRRPSDTVSAYAVTKSAIHGLVRNVAFELGPLGVRVNAVSPGVVDTEMWRQIDRERGRLLGLEPGELLAGAPQLIPLRRLERPEDVANIVAYLLSDDADYMTGQNISYDGGMVMP